MLASHKNIEVRFLDGWIMDQILIDFARGGTFFPFYRCYYYFAFFQREIHLPRTVQSSMNKEAFPKLIWGNEWWAAMRRGEKLSIHLDPKNIDRFSAMIQVSGTIKRGDKSKNFALQQSRHAND